jgi:ABC-type uncharacterized transport system permease subunit
MSTSSSPSSSPALAARWIEPLTPLMALLIALLVADGLILLYGYSPLEIWTTMLQGTLFNPYGMGQVLFKATPLILAGLSVALAFRVGLFNIGGEGQLTLGALATALMGALLPVGTPALVAIPLCMGAGFMGGAIPGSIAGVLKATRNASEVITTLMLNFIAMAFANYLVISHFKVPETQHTPAVIAGARLARLSDFFPALHGSAANLALLISLLACVAIYLWLWKTRTGYRWRAVGLNARAAESAGISLKVSLIGAMTLAGGLAGLIGCNFVLGYKGYFEEGFSSGLGFMGIAVALLGRNHPWGIIPAAFMFALLSQGGLAINAMVPKELVDILQALVIMCVVCASSEVRRWQGGSR